MKYIFALFIFFLPLSVQAAIRDIPPQDADDIKYLFERLILAHDFAYPIFGSKPMSLAFMQLDMPDLPVYKQIRVRFLLMKSQKSLNAWYKYRKEFSFKNFILLDRENDLFEGLVFVLINKSHMLSILHNHEGLFTKELGDSFSPESFLAKIENKEASLAQAINHNYGLLGIMLGYGVRNSMLFQEKHALIEKIEKLNGILDKKSELYKKYQKVCMQLQPFNEFEDLSMIMPIHFLADTTHPETIELRKRYEKDQRKIVELMSQPNFMNLVMERLMQ